MTNGRDTGPGSLGTSLAITKGSLTIASLTPEAAARVQAEFWAQTEEDPDTGCIFWTKGKAGEGCWYGYVEIAGNKVGAHVAAYVFKHGPILDGMQVRHGPVCEGHPNHKGRLCVNVEHLAIGTLKDNMEDRNGGWWARDLNDIPLSAADRAIIEAFLPHAEAILAGPDIHPAIGSAEG